MSAIYSTRFILGSVGAVGRLSYTVPSGLVAIVTTCDLVIDSGSGGAGDMVVVVNTTNFIYVAGPTTNGAPSHAQWSGRMVLSAGDELQLGFDGAGSGQASGYLLTA